jgi:hypothetical protein
MIRTAISPRLAIKTFENMRRALYRPVTFHAAVGAPNPTVRWR